MIRITNINNIVSGWFNQFKDKLGLLPEDIKIKAEKRLKVCESCPSRVKNKCGVCGCNLEAKTKDPKSTCPMKKW